MKTTRLLANASLLALLVACSSAPSTPSPRPEGVALPPSGAAAPAPAASPIVYFEGDVDVRAGTMNVRTRSSPAGGIQPEMILPYGTTAGDVYFHTCTGTVSYSPTAHQLTGSVQAVNLIAGGTVLGMQAHVAWISATAVTASPATIAYGTVATNTASDCGSPSMTWTFDNPNDESFSFWGTAEGTVSCTKVITSSFFLGQSPYVGALTIDYAMVGGGGGAGGGIVRPTGGIGGGGGGGSSLLAGNSFSNIVASGGAGGGAFFYVTDWLDLPGSNGTMLTGSFNLAAGAGFTAIVGGGGGSAGGGGDGGGGGGSGWTGGGGGDAHNSGGGGGGVFPGTATPPGGAGIGSRGGQGALFGGAGGNGPLGGAGQPALGSGGGGYGGGGGDLGGNGGGAGANGVGGPSAGAGASSYTVVGTTLPAAAGAGGVLESGANEGGNAGLIILSYTSPTGQCLL